MDIITKIFLLNWLAVIAACIIDGYILNDAAQKAPVIGGLFGLWAVLAFLSIPTWLVWFIITN